MNDTNNLDNSIKLRLMQDSLKDYTLMLEWFLEPQLQEWVWCDKKGEVPTLERIIEKYGSRLKNPIDVYPYFILLNNKPIGFIQYYIHDKDTIGLDMWIGILEERNKGYGTKALKEIVAIIREKYPSIKQVFIDPDLRNTRAIKCYQKANFKSTGEILDGSLILKIFFKER